MSTDATTLERECQVFTRFLVRQTPTPYVSSKYLEMHRVLPLVPRAPMDRILVSAARWSPGIARIADAYARLAAPRSTLRRKLVALLAILEVSPPFHRAIDEVPTGTLLRTMGHLAVVGLCGVAASVVGVLIFAPVHLVLSLSRQRT